MRLGEFRVVYNAYYNHQAIHKTDSDVWTVEEECRLTFFGLVTLREYWSECKESGYDDMQTIRFKSPEEAFAYVERRLNGNPCGKTIKTIVTEANHERIN